MATIGNIKALRPRIRPLIGYNCAVFIAAAATAEPLAVPAGARYAVIKPAVADVWVRGDATATVPNADDATGASSVICRTTEETWLYLAGVSSISFITSGTNVPVSVSFYKGEDIY